ncbi:MAG TPA: macro domain-containing protein [Phycisphaerales bacterium]|nr:macro domain-containing protein [Phycisphaerales bacterium]
MVIREPETGDTAMQITIGQTRVELIEGDITEMHTDAIVNAANSQLQHGGGVAGAIVHKGGRIIQEESNRIAPVPVGQAAMTGAGNLKCRYVIHAVGPRMGEGDEDAKLQSATLSSLRLADEHALRSVAFCAISTGIFGYPIDRCAEMMLTTVADYVQDSTGLKHIVFCLYDQNAYEVFEAVLRKIKPR